MGSRDAGRAKRWKVAMQELALNGRTDGRANPDIAACAVVGRRAAGEVEET
jgi:hypothetical protein